MKTPIWPSNSPDVFKMDALHDVHNNMRQRIFKYLIQRGYNTAAAEFAIETNNETATTLKPNLTSTAPPQSEVYDRLLLQDNPDLADQFHLSEAYKAAQNGDYESTVASIKNVSSGGGGGIDQLMKYIVAGDEEKPEFTNNLQDSEHRHILTNGVAAAVYVAQHKENEKK